MKRVELVEIKSEYFAIFNTDLMACILNIHINVLPTEANYISVISWLHAKEIKEIPISDYEQKRIKENLRQDR